MNLAEALIMIASSLVMQCNARISYNIYRYVKCPCRMRAHVHCLAISFLTSSGGTSGGGDGGDGGDGEGAAASLSPSLWIPKHGTCPNESCGAHAYMHMSCRVCVCISIGLSQSFIQHRARCTWLWLWRLCWLCVRRRSGFGV